jgi:thiamine-monophosphate kinase
MRIGRLGEFGLIDRIARRLSHRRQGVVIGPGDDCAVVQYDKRRYQLLTCDMLIEDVDFTKRHDPMLVGRKALAVSVSDIAACSGVPAHAVVSVGLPATTTVRYVDKLIAGMNRVCREFNISVVGGDISKSEKLIIDVCMTGYVEKNRLVVRSGARKGDLLLVTGPLGGSRKRRQFMFTPRVKEARYLTQRPGVHAMIDISDGLIQDLRHILRQSNAGAFLFEQLIPVSSDARGLSGALYDGEDFELLVAVERRLAAKVLKLRPRDYFLIGEITDAAHGLTIIDKKNREHVLRPGGYRHF